MHLTVKYDLINLIYFSAYIFICLDTNNLENETFFLQLAEIIYFYYIFF